MNFINYFAVKNTKYPYQAYQFIYMCTTGFDDFKWTARIYNILTEICRPDIWYNQHFIRPSYLKQLTKRILIDQYCQQWSNHMSQTNKGNFYKSLKSNLILENYFKLLPEVLSLYVFKLRTANHRLSIETRRWPRTPIEERTCKVYT